MTASNAKYPMNNNYVVAEYITEGNLDHATKKIEAFIHECGVGSWTDLPYEKNAAKKGPLISSSGLEKDENCHSRTIRFCIKFPIDILGSTISELLLFIMGGISGLDCLQLVNLIISDEYAHRIHGKVPLHNDLIYDLMLIKRRPLIQGIIKPCFGLRRQEISTIVEGMVRGGVDLIKDDELAEHGTLDSQLSRVETIREAIERTSSFVGFYPPYFVQLSGPLERIIERADVLKKAGANGILLSPYALGFDIIPFLKKKINLPIETHPSCSGIFYLGEGAKISPAIVFGLFPRLVGASLSMFFAPEGKFRLSWQDCFSIIKKLKTRKINLPETFPAVAGGIYPAQVPVLCARLGSRIVLGAGGAIVGHPNGPEAGALAMQQAVERSQNLILQTAHIPRELKEANEKWPYNNYQNIYAIRR